MLFIPTNDISEVRGGKKRTTCTIVDFRFPLRLASYLPSFAPIMSVDDTSEPETYIRHFMFVILLVGEARGKNI